MMAKNDMKRGSRGRLKAMKREIEMKKWEI